MQFPEFIQNRGAYKDIGIVSLHIFFPVNILMTTIYRL
jgi:hypothetical protein